MRNEKRHSRISGEAGFGMIEVLVMATLIIIFAFAQVSMMQQQAPLLLHTAQKQEAARLEQLLLSQLANPATCKLNFTGQEFIGVKPPKTSPTGVKANGDKLFIGQGASKHRVASEGKALEQDHQSLYVKTIRINKLLEVAPGNYQGELNISFIHDAKITGDLSAIPIRPISIPISLIASGSGSKKKVTDCAAGVPDSTTETCKIRTRYSTGNSTNTVCCQSNETIISWAAPSDPNSSSFAWQVGNQSCGNIRDIKSGNPVQLLCCK